MSMPVMQTAFAGGELAPSLYGRVDLAKFHIGAALLRNFFVDARGGASTRVGTQFIVPCLPGINRFIDFTFSTTQTYALLFSDLKLRFITNGGALLEATKAITGATAADPCTITIVAHGYANGDRIWIDGVGGMKRLNGRFFIVANVTANTFTLQDATVVQGAAIDATGYAAWTSGGTVARVYIITSPYAAADLALLKFTQSADVMTFTHPSYQPHKLTRSGATSWAFTALSSSASTSPPTLVAAVSSSGGGGTTYRYVVTSVSATGVESPPSTPGVVTNAATMSTTVAENETVTWTPPVVVPPLYNVYRQAEIPAGAASTGSLYGFVGSTQSAAFVDHNIVPDFTQTPPISYDPFAASVWPGCTTYYQGRQAFAGATTLPETINFSRTGDFLNFDYSSPARDDDGIVATIASRQVNAIKHMVPMQSLIVLSSSGAWRVDSGNQSGPITPTSIEAVPQAFNGCSDVPPITINYDVLYVQAQGSIVRDLAYNFYVNVYTGSDMTVLANHLFFGHQITEWAWAEEPFKIIWAVREDGVLLSFTYLKEQDIYAWAHHDTAGQFKSICSIIEGNEAAVYVCVERLINGNLVQYAERMASRNMSAKPDYSPPVPADLTKAWFVDCGLQYPLTTPAATLTPASNGAAPDNIKNDIGNPLIVYSIVGVDNINGGSGYTAPTVSITDMLGTGSGAAVTATVNGGIITGYAVDLAGMNYQQPVFRIDDATGTGAVAQAILSNDVTMTASAASFTLVGLADTFRRTADPTSLGDPSDNGPPWIIDHGTWGIDANHAISSTFDGSVNYAVRNAGYANVAAQFTVTFGPAEAAVGIVLREADTDNKLLVTLTSSPGTTVYIDEIVAGVDTTIATESIADLSGSIVLTARVDSANLISVYVNGVFAASATSAAGATNTIHGMMENSGEPLTLFSEFSVTVLPNADGTQPVGSVGAMMRVNDGWGPVRVYNSPTSVVVNVQYPLSDIYPAVSGDWSCTYPITTVTGLDHLEGMDLSVLADGNVVSDGVENMITVTDGAITLPAGASAIHAGLPYTCQLKSLYTDLPGQNPTAQGRRISINAVTVRVQDSRGLKVGHGFNNLTQIKERDFQPMGFEILPITGDERIIVGSQWEVDAQICIQQDQPLPATVLAFIPELQLGDTPV